MIDDNDDARVVIPARIHSVDAISAKIAECQTSYDTLRLMRDLAGSYGFAYFAIGRFPQPGTTSLSQLYIINNWPPELLRDYDELGILDKSPIVQTLRNTNKPFQWTMNETEGFSAEGARKAVIDLFLRFGMTYGVVFPAQDISGARGIVSFTGTRGPLGDKELLELSYFSTLLYEKAIGLHTSPYAPKQALSGRELECLQWTANGKTSAEIAALLGLSEHTVNHYLAGAGQKLGAVNRTHAVAMAIRANILG